MRTLSRIVASISMLAVSGVAGAQTIVGTISRPGFDPRSVAFFEAQDRLFVADQTSGEIYWFDGTTWTEQGSVAVGGFVRTMLIDEASGKLYAPHTEAVAGSALAVVDAVSGQLITQLEGDSINDYANIFRGHLANDPPRGHVWALHLGGLTRISTADEAETHDNGFGGGGFEGLGVNPVTHEVFVMRFIQTTLVVLDGDTLEMLDTFSNVAGPATVVPVNARENKAYVLLGGGGGTPIRVLDRDTNNIDNVIAGNDALYGIIDPIRNRLYTDSEVNGISTVMDGATDAFFNVMLPQGPATALAVRLATGRVYYAGIDNVGVYDARRDRFSELPVANPNMGGVVVQDIAIDQRGGRVFIIHDARLGSVTVVQDHGEVIVEPTGGLRVDERGATSVISVVLTATPAADVTIAVSSSAPDEATVSTDALRFTPQDARIPQLVTVTGVDDDDSDGAAPFTIVFAAASSSDPQYDGVEPDDVSGANADDEPPPPDAGLADAVPADAVPADAASDLDATSDLDGATDLDAGARDISMPRPDAGNVDTGEDDCSCNTAMPSGEPPLLLVLLVWMLVRRRTRE
jgi:hypothetical protein